jgi:hypothetical protein
MDGFLAVVFLGCVFYSGKVVLDFVSHESVVTPRIVFLTAESERVVAEAEREAVYKASLYDRVQALREDVTKLRRSVQDTRQQVELERHRERRLHIALYKCRIRQSRHVLVP